MKISLDFLARLAGMIALAFLGANIGIALSTPRPDETQLLATQLLVLAGAGLGLLITPRFTIEPVRSLLHHMRTVPLNEMLFISTGGLFGLFFAVLLTIPLAFLPPPLREYMPIVMTLVCVYIGAMAFSAHRRQAQRIAEILQLMLRPRSNLTVAPQNDQMVPAVEQRRYLVDTSSIIDGRIASVGETGFLEGTLLVPLFVLSELQGLADSSDDLRRSKGRRGLELLNQMQKNTELPVEVIDVDVKNTPRVDDKLVVLARQYQCPIITNDFNLNRIAELQGVKVLSLNSLSEATRPPVMQDQHLQVVIRNEGNTRQQGVGYLEDGTPVIVEDARHLIGQNVDVIVTRLHQTATGRLVFAQIGNGTPESDRN
ncbi:MAG: twitching motility protein PilT [Chloroflexaceae bacterium]|nr:twitching motility protein PilT [Chloroflexaceae bacterium]